MRSAGRPASEPLLDPAFTAWLPDLAANAAPASGPALDALGQQLIEDHGDYTLARLLAGPRGPRFAEGARLLAAAIQSNTQGDRETGYARASAAAAAFGAASNQVGELRAREEAVYALSRDFRTPQCLEQSAGLLRRLPGGLYPWARIQTLLARATCLERLGELGSSGALKREARMLAEDHRYAILLLRVIGLQATAASIVGDVDTARKLDYDGLARFWSGLYPPLRAYQFYSDLTDVAQRESRWYAGYLTAKEAVPMIEMAGNRTTEAMARYRLALFAGLTGRRQEMQAEIQRADDLLDRVNGPGSFRAENVILMANFYLQHGEAGLAGEALAGVTDEDVAPSILLQLGFYGARGVAAIRQERPAEARRQFDAAHAVAEAALETVRSPRERATWLNLAGPGYRQLVRLTLEEENDPVHGLALWEKYRSAPVVRRTPPGDGVAELRQLAGELRSASILTFIQFEDGVAGWLVDARGIVPFRSPLSWNAAERVCSAFTEAASNPSSDVEQVRRAGQQVYQALIAPVESRLEAGRLLAIEPDGPCAGVPFEALTDAGGAYLSDHFPLMTSPGAFAARQWDAGRQSVTPASNALIVGNPRVGGDLAGTYPELPDARREAERVASVFPHHTLLTGNAASLAAVRQDLPGAEVFHFAGHGVATGGNGTLLLAAPDAAAGAAWLESSEVERLAARAHLVVLSACYSGEGERLGPFNPDSLIQALWRAGVPTVVATRWAVDSRAAARISAEFYALLTQGRKPAAALQAAQADLRRDPAFAHPALWGAFHVFGSPIPNPEEIRP